jgi:ubiquinone/menaquinone biosynthesis C-methylase UbiE
MMALRRHLAPMVVSMLVALPGMAAAQDEFASDAKRLVAAIQLHEGQTVADIGAGGGQLAVELAREVGPSGRVYATELEEDRRRDIREAAKSAGLMNLEVLEARATGTNLPEQCCDALVMRRVYHHIGNPTLMNTSMLASLKPGGFLAVIDFPPDSAESADPNGRDDGEQHGVTSATVARELGEAGFEVVTVEQGEGSDRYLVVARRPAT